MTSISITTIFQFNLVFSNYIYDSIPKFFH